MKRFYVILAMLATLNPLAVSCGGNEDPEPVEEAEAPVLVSTSPADGTGDITDASLAIVFT